MSLPIRDRYKIIQLLELHATEEANYPGSWCNQGELLSILPNLLRKVDRLAVYNRACDTGDEAVLAGESLLDILCDLLVYLCKYDMYLAVGHDDFQLSQQHLENILTHACKTYTPIDTGYEYEIFMVKIIETLNALVDARMNGTVDTATAREVIASLYKYLTDQIFTLWAE